MKTSKLLQTIRSGWSPIVVIAVTTLATIAISIYCLSSDYFIIFQNLFYIPIIIACVYYTKRGFAFSVIIACLYFLLTIAFTRESSILLQAFVRVLIFVLVAGVITYLSLARKRVEKSLRRQHDDLEGLVQERTAQLEEDIADRKRTDEALRESEVKLQMTIDEATVCVAMVGLDKKFLSCNKAFCAFLGYSEEEMKRKTIADITFTEDVEIGMADLRAVVAGEKKSSIVQKRYVRKDGAVVWGEVSINLIRNSQGQPMYFLPIIQDITERKKAEEERDRLVNLTNNLICIAGMDGYFKFVNPAWEKVLGYTKEELLAKPFLTFIHPEDHHKNDEEVAGLAAGKPTIDFENRYIHKNGSVRHILWTATSKPQENVIYCIGQDITERKRAETELQESELKYRALFESSNDANLLFTEDRWVDCNKAAERVFGCTREQIIGAHPKIFSPQTQPDGRSSGAESVRLINLAYTEGPQFFEWQHIRLNGTPFAADVSLNRVELGGKLYTQAVVRDITERKRAEAELSQERLLVATLLESLPGIFYLQEFDPMPIVVRWNKNTEKVTGYTSQEMFRRPATDFLSPETQERAMKAIQKAMEEGYGQTETGLVTKDGRTIPYIMTAAGLEVSGKPCFVGVGIDISDRKMAEEALQVEKANLDAIFESSPIGMMVLDETTNIVMANAAMAVLAGCGMSDIMNHRPGNALRCNHSMKDPRGCGYSAECHICPARNGIEALLASGGNMQGAELALELVRNGAPQKVWLKLGAEPVLINGRRHLCVAMEDVTERKQAEGKLALNSQRTQALLKLNQMTEATLKEITDFVLEEAVRLTQSKLGYLAFLNEDESVLTMHSWSKSAMAECAINEKPIIYPVASTGLWGEAVRQRRPVITNDYTAANPLKKGYPQGHVVVKRHMNIPVFVGSRIVIVAGVGNKEEEYVQDDIEQLTLLMEGMWRLLERKRAEEKLRESEERYRDTLDNLIEGFYSVTPEGIFLYHNREFSRILGFDPDENLVGKRSPDFWQNPDDRKEYVEKLNENGVLRNYLVLVKKKDVGPRFVELFSRLVRDTQNKPVRIDGAIIDVTERKQAEKALLLKNIVFDASIAANSIADMNGAITEANDAFLRVWGYPSKDEVIGKPLPQFINDQKEAIDIVTTLNNTGQWEGDYTAKRKDGSTFVAYGMATTVKDEKGTVIGYQSAVMDVTGQREAEKEIKKLNESLERRVLERTYELQASNKELESFAYSVSHDLRAPLRIIDGFSHALLEDYDDKLDVQGKDYLRRVRASTQMMALLIDDMLKLSRITRTEMNIEKVNLTQIARSVIDELQKSQPERLINIKIADGLEDTADARLMRVALENLLGNAWKFTGKQAEAVIEFGATKEGERKVYFIRDNGAGFDMAYVDKLFAPFQRLHTLEEYPGTGIGLATVRRIINRHGGRVWTEGQVGKGATFYFSLQG